MFPLMFAYMCFSCGDLDSVQVGLIKIAQSFANLTDHMSIVNANVIVGV
jgi:hypothetical protein